MSNQNNNPQLIDKHITSPETDSLRGDIGPRNLETITTDILRQKSEIVHSYLAIGRLLIEAKEQLNGHGHWLKWLSESVDISERMAQRYMKLAKAYPNPTALSDLNMTKALALLVLPEDQREDFIKESHEVNGAPKTVVEMSTRELKHVIKNAEKRDTAPTIKPIRRNTLCRDVGEVELSHEVESAKKSLTEILDFLERNPSRSSAKVVDDLRSLLEQVQRCIQLVEPEAMAS